MEGDLERESLVRKWQARVFTRHVPKGSEHLYRLGLALKEFALANFFTPPPHGLHSFDGIQYPSVASTLFFDNVALLPSTIDSKFELIEARLLGMLSGITADARVESTFKVMDYDCAAPDSEGRLIWGSERTFSFDEMIGTKATPTEKNPVRIEKTVSFVL
jgi:hypothetical protein